MSTQSTKMAAAVAAVQAFLDEEAAVAAESAAQAEAYRRELAHAASPWAMSGRQEIMTLRRLIQLKAF